MEKNIILYKARQGGRVLSKNSNSKANMHFWFIHFRKENTTRTAKDSENTSYIESLKSLHIWLIKEDNGYQWLTHKMAKCLYQNLLRR